MRGSACLLGLCLASVASAAPSQLITIPTADIVPAGQCAVQVQNGDTNLRGPGSLFEQPEPAIQSQFGFLRSRLESGADLVALDSPSDYRAVLNLKALLLPEGYHLPAIAVGVAQVGRGFDAYYYLVASRTLNYGAMQYQRFRAHHRNLKLRGIRLHAGVLGTAGDPRGQVGSDIQVSDHAVLQADWISGHDHVAALGATWVLNQQVSIQAALMRGNNSQRLDGLQAGVTRQFGW